MKNSNKLILLSIAILTCNPYVLQANKKKSHQNDRAINETRNDRGETPLIQAARENNVEYALYLIKHGAHVNAATTSIGDNCSYGYTPLHYAQDISIVKALLNAGANVHAQNDMRLTPLHETNSVEKAQLLLNAGADINAKGIYGITPLLSLMESNATYNLIKFILDAGADVHAYFDNGEIQGTPLTMFFTGFLINDDQLGEAEQFMRKTIADRATLEKNAN